jgi:hypothetical protein
VLARKPCSGGSGGGAKKVQREAKDGTMFDVRANMIPDLRYCFPREPLKSVKQEPVRFTDSSLKRPR